MENESNYSEEGNEDYNIMGVLFLEILQNKITYLLHAPVCSLNTYLKTVENHTNNHN